MEEEHYRLILEHLADLLHKAANGGLRMPGQAERVANHKRLERELRDLILNVLEDQPFARRYAAHFRQREEV